MEKREVVPGEAVCPPHEAAVTVPPSIFFSYLFRAFAGSACGSLSAWPTPVPSSVRSVRVRGKPHTVQGGGAGWTRQAGRRRCARTWPRCGEPVVHPLSLDNPPSSCPGCGGGSGDATLARGDSDGRLPRGGCFAEKVVHKIVRHCGVRGDCEVSVAGWEGRPLDPGRIDRGRAMSWLRGNEDVYFFSRARQGRCVDGSYRGLGGGGRRGGQQGYCCKGKPADDERTSQGGWAPDVAHIRAPSVREAWQRGTRQARASSPMTPLPLPSISLCFTPRGTSTSTRRRLESGMRPLRGGRYGGRPVLDGHRWARAFPTRLAPLDSRGRTVCMYTRE